MLARFCSRSKVLEAFSARARLSSKIISWNIARAQISPVVVHVRIVITLAVAELSDQKIKSKVGIFSKVKKSHVFSSNKRQYYL